MARLLRVAPVAAMLLVLWTRASAAVLCVNPGGTGGCFSSVQAAVDVAEPRDVIEVAAGTYAENVTILGRGALTIRGAGAGATIVDGADPGTPTVWAVGVGERRRLTLEDLTVTNADRGIIIWDRARVLVRRCEMVGDGAGVGFHVAEARGLQRLQLSWIHGYYIGVSSDYNSRIRIGRTTISENATGVEGWTSSLNATARIRILDSTISANDSGLTYGRFRIVRSTITGNTEGIVAPIVEFLLTFARLQASIVSDNATNCVGRVVSRVSNYLGTDCPVHDLDAIGDDPMLGPLQDNGGLAPTHAPAPASPVLEQVMLRRMCRNLDQREAPRQPEPCDVGALEVP